MLVIGSPLSWGFVFVDVLKCLLVLLVLGVVVGACPYALLSCLVLGCLFYERTRFFRSI